MALDRDGIGTSCVNRRSDISSGPALTRGWAATGGRPYSEGGAGSVRELSRRGFLAAASSMVLAACASGPATSADVLAWGAQGTRDGAFMRPRAIGVRDGEVYVVDTTGRIQVFTRDGVFARQWRMPEHDNGTPTCIAFAADGRVLIPDTHYSRIAEYTTDGEPLTTWGSYGTAPGTFIYPTGIAESSDGRYYISEYGVDAERVQVFSKDRAFARTWGAHGTEPGQFNRAMAIFVAADDTICVSDTINHRLQVFDAGGNLVRIIGAPGTERGELKFPQGIALAADGSVVVCEYGANRVSRFRMTGEYLGSFGGAGRALGQFAAPRGVAVSAEGDVFVADTENHRIQRFALEAIA